MIPESPPNPERAAIKILFNHRLAPEAGQAQREWYSIVDGTSDLWKSVTTAKKELIRSFFNLLNMEILKRARPPSSTFDFTAASVGNLFLTSARLFSGSFESAIYLLSSICGVPSDIIRVIPAINSNFSHHISASLEDGTVIVGQNSISHPTEVAPFHSSPDAICSGHQQLAADDEVGQSGHDAAATYEGDHMPGSLRSLSNKNISFSKENNQQLASPISRVWYINPYGQEIRPPANPRVLETIRSSQAIIYSIGSLYTSIIPSLILRGVGQSIVSSSARHKILILNGSLDRETGSKSHSYTGADFVEAITRAGEESRGSVPDHYNSSEQDHTSASPPRPPLPYYDYVTHVLHLDGLGTPRVDREGLSQMGIETLRLYGRPVMARDTEKEVPAGMRYDPTALVQAIEVVLGKKGDAILRGGPGSVLSRSRRNTLESIGNSAKR